MEVAASASEAEASPESLKPSPDSKETGTQRKQWTTQEDETVRPWPPAQIFFALTRALHSC